MSWALTEKSSKFDLPRDISDVFTCAACSAAIGALVKVSSQKNIVLWVFFGTKCKIAAISTASHRATRQKSSPWTI